MIEHTGNLFDSTAKHLGHGVNCRGKMGAGIAKQFRLRFPSMYWDYKNACERGLLQPGEDWAYYSELDKVWIHNIASQRETGPDAKYSWLFLGLSQAVRYVEMVNDDRLAIPEIGCGIGGLIWSDVKDVILEVEQNNPKVQIEVWHYA